MFSYSLLVRSGIAILLWSQVSIGQGDGFSTEKEIEEAADNLEIREVVSQRGNSTLRVYPSLEFNCNGNITSVTMLGRKSGSRTARPVIELQLWRTADSSTDGFEAIRDINCQYQFIRTLKYQYHTTGSVIQLDIESGGNVQEGNILGIKQPDNLILLYQDADTGPQSYTPRGNGACILGGDRRNDDQYYPLISVELAINSFLTDCDSNDGCDGDCTSGFLLPEQLRTAIEYFRPDETTIIPDLTFTSAGTVTSWQFVAIQRQSSQGSQNSMSIPHIQIWRPMIRLNSNTGASCYRLIDSTSEHEFKKDDNIYTLDSEMEVKVGDVVGVWQPLDSQFWLVLSDEKSTSIFTGLNRTCANPVINKQLPLLRPEFQASTTTDVPSSPPHPTSTTSTEPPTDSESPDDPSMQPTVQSPSSPPPAAQGGVPVVALAGAGVGVAVVGLLVMVVAVLVCILCRKRRKLQQTTSNGLSQNNTPGNNPVYHAPINDNLAEPFYIEPVRRRENSELYESIQVAQMYEVPTTSLSPDQKQSETQTEPTYHVIETASKERGYEEDDDDSDNYHTLEPPTSVPVGGQRGHEYQELEGPTAVETEEHQDGYFSPNDRLYHTLENGRMGGGNEDYELYVPSMEQRKTVQSSTTGQHLSSSDIYGSLHETQLRATSVSPASTVSLQFFEECPSFWEPGSTTESLYQQLASRKFREICRHQIQTTKHLGSGQFGRVKKGIWQTSKGTKEVAVKMLQSNPTGQDTVRFLQEAAIMGQFRHPNIIQLHGVVTVDKPLMIVLELLCNGDLNTYLNKNKPCAGKSPAPEWPGMLLSFCQHVAAGMDYLATKGFVHRDLAARNILLTKDRVCKISDFGMSRDLQNENYYVTRGGEIPVKWTAPETLNYKKYSTASDVWSYGVVMYEIWSLGHKPFEGHTNPEAVKLVDDGYRLAPPPGCPREIYWLMIQCWHPTAGGRPSSSEILRELTKPEDCLLQWREEDSQCHPQASLLGAELTAGKHLYTELQNTYLQQ